jgi:hypothetical protein
VRVRDQEKAIYHGPRALEWYRYLSAMWIISGELRDLYADRLAGPERSLLADSLATVRTAVLEHQVTQGTASDASRLNLAWEALIPDQLVPPDQLGAIPDHRGRRRGRLPVEASRRSAAFTMSRRILLLRRWRG